MAQRFLLNRSILQTGVAAALDKALLPPSGLQWPPFHPPGAVTTVQGPGMIGFKLNGVLRWLIDLQRFAGNAQLITKPTPQHGLRIELKQARFPGTQLSADFVCVLHPKGVLGTPMDIKFTLGGFWFNPGSNEQVFVTSLGVAF